MKKLTQRQRIINQLLKDGYVSRNYYINLPYDRILRLGALIFDLRQSGWDFETKDDGRDCTYTMTKCPLTKIVYKIGDREVVTYK